MEEKRPLTRHESDGESRHDRVRRGAPGRVDREAAAGPEGWVRAAQELPLARLEVDEIVARAVADAEFRTALIADLRRRSKRRATRPTARVAFLRERLPDLR